MTKIETGNAVAITIINNDGVPETFKLGIVKENGWLGKQRYVFINDSGIFYQGIYSGGSTGGGLSDPRNINDEYSGGSYTLVTTNLDDINRIVDEENAKKEEKIANAKKEAEEKEARVKEALGIGIPKVIYDDDSYEITATPVYSAYSVFEKFSIDFCLIDKAKRSNSENQTPSYYSKGILFEDFTTPTGRVSKYAKTTYGISGTNMALAMTEARKELSAKYHNC